MTIKKHGGIFGRNPAFNEVDANKLNVDNLQLDGNTVRSTDTNGNIGLIPDGTGSLLIGSNNQASYVAAKIRKKFNGSVSVQFDGGGTAIYADLSMDANENLSLRLDPGHVVNDQTFSITHDGSAIAQFIGSSGDVKVNQGNLVIGTSGKGIDFSANTGAAGVTSQLLDDYEEGTFTPAFYGSGLSVTYDRQKGKYVKIGNIVFFVIELGTDAVSGGSSSTALEISGLPYPMDTNTDAAQKISWSYGFGTDVSNASWAAGSVSRLDLYLHNNTATTVKTDVLATGTNANRLYITGQYFIG